MNLNKTNFCIKPFVHTTVKTDGTYELCCQSMCKLSDFNGQTKFNIKNNTVEDWFNSEYMNYVRSSLLENKKLKECNNCWLDEAKELKSLRQISNDSYKLYIDKNLAEQLKNQHLNDLRFPIDWELQITNLCNLSCHMCQSYNSSKLLIENKKLFNEQNDQKNYDINDFAIEQLKNIFASNSKIITLRGGETLIIPEITKLLEESVLSKKSKDIDLHITTNGTYLPDRIIEILSKFKSVRIMLSLESTEKTNEYIRFPSNWKLIEKNVQEFKKLKNTSVIVNTTIQNLNILYLKSLVEWCDDNKIWLIWDLLKEPHYLQIDNLPYDLKKEALIRLTNIEITYGKSLSLLKNYLKTLLDVEPNIDLWNKFVYITNARDKFRKTSIKESLPEFKQFF